MRGWLGTYMERRRRRKARAAKMAAESAAMAAMLQANAPRRGRKSFWRTVFGMKQKRSAPVAAAPVPSAAPPPVVKPQPATPSPAPSPALARAVPAAAVAAPMVVPVVRAALPENAASMTPEVGIEAAPAADMPPEMYGPPAPPPAVVVAQGAPVPPAVVADAPRPHVAPAMTEAVPEVAAPVAVAASPVVVAAPARSRWLLASLGWVLRVAVIVLLLGGVLAVAAWPVWRESARLDVEVLPLAVPADLAAGGLSPEVAAGRLVDALAETLARTRENDRNRPSKTELGHIPTISATPQGLGLRSLASLLREARGIPAWRIAGDITRLDGRLEVRLRLPGGASFATVSVPEGDGVGRALGEAAPLVWRRLNPVIYAWHVADSGEPEDKVRPVLVGLAQELRLPQAAEVQVSVLYARSLARSGRGEEALATLEQVERRAGPMPLLWNVKAQALADLGRAEAALDAQKRAVVQEGTSVWSHISSAHLMMKLGRPREALTDLQSARRLSPNNFDAVLLEGMVLLGGGRPAEALALINRVVDTRPNQPGVQEALGNALLANGRVDDAMRVFDAEIARNPNAVTVRLARANALRSMRKPEEALAAVDDILRIAPRDGVALSLRGWTLMDLGRADQALELFDTLLKDRPDDAAALHARGLALAVLGRRAEAIGAVTRATELQPGNRRFAADLVRLRGGSAPPQGGARPAAPATQGGAAPAAPAPRP